MRVAIGMDLHKKTAVCFAVYAGEGKPYDRDVLFLEKFNKEFKTNGTGPEDMFELVKAMAGHEVHVLIENSTKTYETYWTLTNLGVHVTVAQAQDLFRITKSVKKTDSNDAAELAAYMRRRLNGEDEFAVCTMPPKEWMLRRELCRAILNEKMHLGDLKRRMRMHLLLHGITGYDKVPDIFSGYSAKKLRTVDDSVVQIILAEAKSVKERIRMEEKLLEHEFSDNRMFRLLLSIPGIGLVTAAYLTALIMDIGRFQSCNCFTAYFGVTPKMRESAESSPHCATTHRGDAYARMLICQAALVHVQHAEGSVVTAMYNRLRANGKSFKETQVACARKLLVVIWAVLKADRPYTNDAKLLADASAASEQAQEDMTEA